MAGREPGDIKIRTIFIQLTIIHDFTAEFIKLYIDYKVRLRPDGSRRQIQQAILGRRLPAKKPRGAAKMIGRYQNRTKIIE